MANNQKTDFLVIGSTAVDLLASSKAIFHTSRVTRHHREEFASIAFASKTTLDSLSVQVGGSAANCAVALARFGEKIRLKSAVGGDVFASFILSDLQSKGVPVQGIAKFKKAGCGIAVSIIASSGEKSTLIFKGANNLLSPKNLSEKEVQNAESILMTSLPSKSNYELVKKAIALAKKFGKKIFFCPSITMLRQRHLTLSDLHESFDAVIMNQEEAEYFTQKTTALGALQALNGKVCVITLGEKGALLKDGGKIFSIQALPAKVLDTTGAGDCFCAVFSHYLSKGEPSLDALKKATAAAAMKITQVGAQFKASKREFEAFYSKNKSRLKIAAI